MTDHSKRSAPPATHRWFARFILACRIWYGGLPFRSFGPIEAWLRSWRAAERTLVRRERAARVWEKHLRGELITLDEFLRRRGWEEVDGQWIAPERKKSP